MRLRLIPLQKPAAKNIRGRVCEVIERSTKKGILIDVVAKVLAEETTKEIGDLKNKMKLLRAEMVGTYPELDEAFRGVGQNTEGVYSVVMESLQSLMKTSKASRTVGLKKLRELRERGNILPDLNDMLKEGKKLPVVKQGNQARP